MQPRRDGAGRRETVPGDGGELRREADGGALHLHGGHDGKGGTSGGRGAAGPGDGLYARRGSLGSSAIRVQGARQARRGPAGGSESLLCFLAFLSSICTYHEP